MILGSMARAPSIRFRVPAERLTPFGEWLLEHRESFDTAAHALGCSRQHVQMLATGKSVPRLAMAARIEKWTGRKAPDDSILIQTWIPYLPPRDLVLGS